jgi:hypothetical protein
MANSRIGQPELSFLGELNDLNTKMKQVNLALNKGNLDQNQMHAKLEERESLSIEYQQLVANIAEQIREVNIYQFSQLDRLDFAGEKEHPVSHKRLNDSLIRLSQLIIFSILREQDITKRTLTMEFWVSVLKNSFEAGDFLTAQFVFDSLNSTEIYRLTATYNGLSFDAKEILEKFKHLIVDEKTKRPGPEHFRQAMMVNTNDFIIPSAHTYRALLIKNEDVSVPVQEHPLVKEFRFLQAAVKSKAGAIIAKMPQQAKRNDLQKFLLAEGKTIEPKQFADQGYQLSIALEQKGVHYDSTPILQASPNLITPKKLKLDDGSFQLLVNKVAKSIISEYSKKALESLNQYINAPYKDSLDQQRKELLNAVLNRLQGKNTKHKLLILENLLNPKSPEADAIILNKHHMGPKGIYRQLKNKDTKAHKLLEQLYKTIEREHNLNKDITQSWRELNVTSKTQFARFKQTEAKQESNKTHLLNPELKVRTFLPNSQADLGVTKAPVKAAANTRLDPKLRPTLTQPKLDDSVQNKIIYFDQIAAKNTLATKPTGTESKRAYKQEEFSSPTAKIYTGHNPHTFLAKPVAKKPTVKTVRNLIQLWEERAKREGEKSTLPEPNNSGPSGGP